MPYPLPCFAVAASDCPSGDQTGKVLSEGSNVKRVDTPRAISKANVVWRQSRHGMPGARRKRPQRSQVGPRRVAVGMHPQVLAECRLADGLALHFVHAEPLVGLLEDPVGSAGPKHGRTGATAGAHHGGRPRIRAQRMVRQMRRQVRGNADRIAACIPASGAPLDAAQYQTFLQSTQGFLAACGMKVTFETPPAATDGAWLAARPDVRIDNVAGAGHWVMYEAADEVNALMLDFMK